MKKEARTILPISIIIPTFSEEIVLPKLLQSIDEQLFQPDEVIVADAQSPDKTREIAKKHGCVIVEGGKISEGRNAGAKVAKNEYLLFLDADTILPKKTILLEALTEFIKTDCDIASAGFLADKDGATKFGYAAGSIIFTSWNALRKFQEITHTAFAQGGAFILVKKSVFKHIKGFDERILLSEDVDFFKRAIKNGYKYLHLRQSIVTSTRRFSTPKKASKSLGTSFGHALLVLAGVYAGSQLFRRLSKGYGRLGGGKGSDPSEE